MVYYDDQAPPIQHLPLPYDPWDDPGYGPPVAPISDVPRQEILNVICLHPNWGPTRVKAYLERSEPGVVPIAAILGAKAGM